VRYAYGRSRAVQAFYYYREPDTVKVRVAADRYDPQAALKRSFPVNFSFRRPTYEIPYGFLEKSANGEEEQGQTGFDFTGGHFVSGEIYGLAIANDAKYGYSMNVDEMSLTVLRNPVFAHHTPKELEPGKQYRCADDGPQEFT
jgi:alpha-mannosidase